MKSLIKILIIVLSQVILFGQDCETKLTIESEISNVKIFIDDSLEYDYQKEIILSPGEHKIIIQENSDRWDAKTIVENISIEKCEHKKIVFSTKSEVFIDSNPQDASVFYSDSLLGFTPLLLSSYYSNLTLKKNGYQDVDIFIFGIDPLLVKMNYTGLGQKDKFFDTAISKILVGSFIVLGATSAYFKVKADNRYDEYLKTGQRQLLDDTNRFDLISGISIAATQINLGVLIYFLLSE